MGQWDPFKESTEKWDKLMRVIDNNALSFIVGLCVVVGLCSGTYIWRLHMITNTLPCSVLNEKLEKFSMPSYYKLTPVAEDRIKTSTTEP
jgi:hypothetical protein